MDDWGAAAPTLLGRQTEMAVARSAFESGTRRGVLIVGQAGVGKTRLARAILDELRSQPDHDVTWLVASASGPSIPFGAFAPLVPEIGGKPGRQPDAFYLLQTLRRAVVARAGGRRLVLGVDDGHRLDGSSATLLFQLVAEEGALAVLASRANAQPAEAVRSLWKDGFVERIDLDPLGRDDSLKMAIALLQGGPGAGVGAGDGAGDRGPRLVSGELAEALWRVSQGNPLYLRELVLVGRQSGRIVADRGMWRLEGDLTVGPRLTEILQERLQHLRDEEIAALEVVAFADPLPLRIMAMLVSGPRIASLQREGLLTVEVSQGEQLVRTAHPLYAEAIRAATPVTRATELRGKLADVFEADGRTATDMLRIVSWRLDAGGQPAPELLEAAAVRAAERQDWELSRRLAEAAVAASGRAQAVFALADALRMLGRYEEALTLLGDRQGDGDDEVARVAVLRAFSLFWGLGRSDEAVDGLAEAAARIREISHRTWVEAVHSGLLTLTGRSPEGVALARPLVTRTGLSARTEMTALSALAMGLALTGRPEEAIKVAEGCLTRDPLAEGDSLALMWTTHSRFLAYRISGRLGELEALASDHYRLALQLNNRSGQGAAAAALGWVALPRGELSRAVAYFREAASLLERVDPTGLRIPALGALAETLAIIGDVEGAAAAHAEAVGRPAGSDGDGEEAHHRLIMSAAWIIAARGEVSRALTLLDRIAAEAANSGQVSLEIMSLSAMTRLGSPHLERRVADLAGRVEGPLVQVIAAHASALGDVSGASGSAERLDEVTERYAAMTFNLYAAEAAAQASRAHGLAGNARKAAASAARAHFLLGSHEGPRPLGLSVALTPPGLTRREQEVALLAVRGLSSQAIADRLCVSVRTVDTHLTRVYYKLGISSRGQLAGVLAVDPSAVAAAANATDPALPVAAPDEPDSTDAVEG